MRRAKFSLAPVLGLALGLMLAHAVPGMAQTSWATPAAQTATAVPASLAPASAAPVVPTGRWATENGRSHIEIAPCGQKFCGKIVWMAEPLDEAGRPKLDQNNPAEELRSRPMLGLQLLSDFVAADSPGRWIGGKIYNPRDGELYSASLMLTEATSLSVHGYVLLPLFGKTQIWKKVESAGATAVATPGAPLDSK